MMGTFPRGTNSPHEETQSLLTNYCQCTSGYTCPLHRSSEYPYTSTNPTYYWHSTVEKPDKPTKHEKALLGVLTRIAEALEEIAYDH